MADTHLFGSIADLCARYGIEYRGGCVEVVPMYVFTNAAQTVMPVVENTFTAVLHADNQDGAGRFTLLPPPHANGEELRLTPTELQPDTAAIVLFISAGLLYNNERWSRQNMELLVRTVVLTTHQYKTLRGLAKNISDELTAAADVYTGTIVNARTFSLLYTAAKYSL